MMVKPEYKKTRLELTEVFNSAMNDGKQVYRVRHDCECFRSGILTPQENLKASQRNAIIIIENDKVERLLVRCKRCAVRTEERE